MVDPSPIYGETDIYMDIPTTLWINITLYTMGNAEQIV